MKHDGTSSSKYHVGSYQEQQTESRSTGRRERTNLPALLLSPSPPSTTNAIKEQPFEFETSSHPEPPTEESKNLNQSNHIPEASKVEEDDIHFQCSEEQDASKLDNLTGSLMHRNGSILLFGDVSSSVKNKQKRRRDLEAGGV